MTTYTKQQMIEKWAQIKSQVKTAWHRSYHYQARNPDTTLEVKNNLSDGVVPSQPDAPIKSPGDEEKSSPKAQIHTPTQDDDRS